MKERWITTLDVLYVLKNGFVYDPPEKATRPGYYKYKMINPTPNSNRREVRVVVIPSMEAAVPQGKIATVMWADEPDVLKRHGGMTGAELKFLRTLMGMTQAELGKIVNREAQTIGRWERGEFENDPNTEAIIRLVAAERLSLKLDAPTEDVTGWCLQTADNPAIRIDASDPENYRPLAA